MIPTQKGLQLNKHVQCAIPHNRDLYRRYGERVPSSSNLENQDARFDLDKEDGYMEAIKVVSHYDAEEQRKYDEQQAEIERLRAASVEKNDE